MNNEKIQKNENEINRIQSLRDLSPFICGPKAETDLHAGGIFFCVLYQEALTFVDDNKVELEYQIIDNWRPLDDEAEVIKEKSCSGMLSIDNKRNLNIEFPNMTYYGCECENQFGHIAFYINGEIQYPDDFKKIYGSGSEKLPQHFTESSVYISTVVTKKKY